MTIEFTVEEFDRWIKEDGAFRKEWEKLEWFEQWISMQGEGLRKEIDDKCKEYIQQLNDKKD
jgi:hypothetical protein